MNQDTHFDNLAGHFQKRIYGSQKGAIRLAILERDLRETVPDLSSRSFKVLDMGAGMAQMSLKLAKQGHDVLINDLSKNMFGVGERRS